MGFGLILFSFQITVCLKISYSEIKTTFLSFGTGIIILDYFFQNVDNIQLTPYPKLS